MLMFVWTSPFLILLVATLFLPPNIVNGITGLVFLATTIVFVILARLFPRESAESNP
jgi:hypothetical protein